MRLVRPVLAPGTCRPRSRSGARRALAILEGPRASISGRASVADAPGYPDPRAALEVVVDCLQFREGSSDFAPADADSPSSARMKSGAPKARLVALAALTHREQKGCSASLAAVRFRRVANPVEDQASRLGGEGRVLHELPAVQRPAVEEAALVARAGVADDRARFVERRSPVAPSADLEEGGAQGVGAGLVDSEAGPKPSTGEADNAGQRQAAAVLDGSGAAH
jgi:hypothetical protein